MKVPGFRSLLFSVLQKNYTKRSSNMTKFLMIFSESEDTLKASRGDEKSHEETTRQGRAIGRALKSAAWIS